MSHPLAYLSFTGGTGIISLNGLDAYVFTQADGGDTAATDDNKRTMTDRIFIASIPDGEIIYDEALDFKVRLDQRLSLRLHISSFVLRARHVNSLRCSRELLEARSRLYRGRPLQVNTRWKALDEIYNIYILLHRSDLKISAKNRQHFFTNK